MKPSIVRVYLEASSKDDLIDEQIKNNLVHGCYFEYSVPMKDGDKWITWYFKDVLKQDKK